MNIELTAAHVEEATKKKGLSPILVAVKAAFPDKEVVLSTFTVTIDKKEYSIYSTVLIDNQHYFKTGYMEPRTFDLMPTFKE